MDAVEIRTQGSRPVAMALPYPFPIDSFPQEGGFRDLRAAASSFGFPYFFVVARDRTRGWSVDNPAPIFDQPTRKLLAPYASQGTRVESAWVDLLAALTSTWMADLQWHWKSRTKKAPGEDALPAEFLELLREDEPRPPV